MKYSNETLLKKFKEEHLIVACSTRKEANRFIKWCNENDMKGIEEKDVHFIYTNHICFHYDGSLLSSSYYHYKSLNYTITPFQDIFLDDFTKKDIRAGQIVKCRNGELYKVLPTVDELSFINKDKLWFSIDYINNNLTASFIDPNSNYDIMEVYGFPRMPCDLLNFDTRGRKLLWYREEVKEMTVDEISKILGYEVKVIGGDK